MRRFSSALLAVFALALLASLCVHASGAYLTDGADLLTDGEESAAAQALERASRDCGADLVVVTTASLGGKGAQSFADDFYENGGYGADGAVLLVDMGGRSWYISTFGFCADALGDSELDSLEESVIPLLSSGDYAGAFRAFANYCADFIKAAEGAGPFGVVVNSAKSARPFGVVKHILISLAIGLGVALVTVLYMKSRLKSVLRQTAAAQYVRAGSLNVSNARDIFLYKTVDCREIPKSNASNGGGHSGGGASSSGRTHGGRGGKF